MVKKEYEDEDHLVLSCASGFLVLDDVTVEYVPAVKNENGAIKTKAIPGENGEHWFGSLNSAMNYIKNKKKVK